MEAMFPGEEFRHVELDWCKDYYYVSNYGRVFSAKLQRIIFPIMDKDGYWRVTLTTNKGNSTSKSVLVHRLMMLTFFPIPNANEMQVNHIDGIKTHNSFDNLEWVTPQQNTRHAYDNGLAKRGELMPFAILTNEQVHQICQMLCDGYSCPQIAKIIGCETYLVQHISSRVCWQHISCQYDFPYRGKDPVFTDDEVHIICNFYQNNPKPDTMSMYDYDAIALQLCGKDMSENMRTCIRAIRLRQTYKHISKNYIF